MIVLYTRLKPSAKPQSLVLGLFPATMWGILFSGVRKFYQPADSVSLMFYVPIDPRNGQTNGKCNMQERLNKLNPSKFGYDCINFEVS